MNVKTRRKLRMCRFCLQHDSLIGLSKVIGVAFGSDDVVYYTGILIPEHEEVTVCNACCVAISNSVNFRRTCLSNDIIFKKLISVVEVNVPASDHSIVVDSDSQHSTEDNSFEEGARNDTGITTMDYTDSDDSSGQNESKQEIVESHSNERLNKCSTDNSTAEQLMSAVDEKKKNGNATDSKQHSLSTLEGIDDLTSSSSGVAVRVALNDKITSNSSASELKHLPNDTLGGLTTLARRPYAYRSLKTPNDSDSDDSVISLYSEVMAKAEKELLEARRAEQRMQRSMMHAVKSVTPPEGASELERKPKPTDPITEANLKPLDDADSDGSMDSLYKVQSSITVKTKPLKAVELCPYCGVMTTEWLNHVNRTHIKKMRFVCPHCPKQFGERYSLKEHVNTAHEKRILYTCALCGKGFVCTGSHYYHMTNVHGKKDVYECETCHRKLRSFDGYKKHLKIHSLTSIPCPHCDKVFKTAETLEKHSRRYHSS